MPIISKYSNLFFVATQEEAAIAYDMAAIEYRGLNAVTNFDLSRYIKWLKPSTAASTNPNRDIADTKTGSCSIHDSSTLPSLHQPSDAATSQLRPTTATSALGLLLQSSKFKELMEMNMAAEYPSTPQQPLHPPQNVVAEDEQTIFESNDFCSYNNQDEDIYVDFSSIMHPPMAQFHSLLNGEDLEL